MNKIVIMRLVLWMIIEMLHSSDASPTRHCPSETFIHPRSLQEHLKAELRSVALF